MIKKFQSRTSQRKYKHVNNIFIHYIYIYIYIYIYLYLYVYIVIYLYIYFKISLYLHMYMCMCRCSILPHTYIYIYIYTHTYIHIPTSLIEIVMWRFVSETTSPEEAYVAKNLCAAPKSTGHQGIPLSFLQLPRSRYVGDARRAVVACQ